MTPYWIATAAAWLIVGIYATPGAWAAAVRQSQRRGDPMRLAVWLVALVMVTGSGRWLFSPSSDVAWKAVYVIAVLAAGFVLRLMRAYGRGALVVDPLRLHDEDGADHE